MDMSSLLESPSITTVATGFKFTEGPVWHPDGYLLFTEIGDPWQIWRVIPGQPKELYRDNTNRATGLTLDLNGDLIACEQMSRSVTKMHPSGTISSIATHYEGQRLNRPNDVVGRSDGNLYFSNRGAGSWEDETDIEENGVYRISPEGEVCLLYTSPSPRD